MNSMYDTYKFAYDVIPYVHTYADAYMNSTHMISYTFIEYGIFAMSVSK
jgi:hypothetical protein